MIRHHHFPLRGRPEITHRPGALSQEEVECAGEQFSLTVVGRCVLGPEPVGPAELLRAFESGGIEALEPFDGPFVLEIIDHTQGEVTLVGSPRGHRQGYFVADQSRLVWGTDLRGMLPHLPRRRLSPSALVEVLNCRWCLGDAALVDGIRQIQPGTAFIVSADGMREHRRLYWPDYTPGEDNRPWEELVDGLISELRSQLEGALRTAERPWVLLSGGVDSALLAAVAMEVREDIVAVTPTWDRHPNPELDRARNVARHLGITHHEQRISEEDLARAADDFISLTGLMPRDFWAVVLLATFRNLRGQGDVVLHGQGADGALGGSWGGRRTRVLRQMRILHALVPRPIRRLVGPLLPLDRNYLTDLRVMLLDDPERALTRRGLVELAPLIRHRHHDLFGDGDGEPTVLDRFYDPNDNPTSGRRRLGMFLFHRANLLEVEAVAQENDFRVVYPFLDRKVADFCRSIPLSKRGNKEWGRKPVARMAYSRYLPEEWSKQPKLGFITPVVPWMESCWKDWVDDRLGPDSFARRALGATVDELELERDHQLMWTLAAIEEFIREFDLERPEF